MKAADIMRQPVLATTPQAWVHDVLVELVSNQVSGMPVVEPDGTVIGIVTEGDILRTFVEGTHLDLLTVQSIMTRDPVTVDVETPLVAVMQTMYDEGILRIPVVEDGRLVGIISRRDVIMALAQPGHLGSQEFPIFHRHYSATPDAGGRAPAEQHLVPTYGW